MATLSEVATQLIAAPDLLALPHLYDAPPVTHWETLQRSGQTIRPRSGDGLTAAATPLRKRDHLREDLKIAVSHSAQVGLTLVRMAGLAMLVTSSPIALALGGLGALSTSHQLLGQLRFIFRDDPRIRRLVEESEGAAARGDLERAEEHLKDALAVDINPTNQRNATLHLHLGQLYVRMGKPRQALIAFSRASVLFSESDSFPTKDREGRTIQVSARGFAELMTIRCLDQFAIDDAGLQEWSAVAAESSSSALLRLENFSQKREGGWLGLGIRTDDDSARFNRQLAAHVQFLRAKFATVAALQHHAPSSFAPDVAGAIRMVLDDEALGRADKGNLLLQQSRFYFEMARRHPSIAIPCVDAALDLTRQGLEYVENPVDALAIRAEIMSWQAEVLPRLATANTAGVQERLPAYREQWGALVRHVESAHGPATTSRGFVPWGYDVLYRSASTPSDRLDAARSGLAACASAGDASWELQFALRARFLQPQDPAWRKACTEAAAQLAAHADPVLRSFGLRYRAIDLEHDDTAAAADLLAEAARLALGAIATVRDQSLPFLLQGRVVLHPPAVARIILWAHAAWCLHRARDAARLHDCLAVGQMEIEQLGQPYGFALLDAFTAAAAFGAGDHAYAESILAKGSTRYAANVATEVRRLAELWKVAAPKTESPVTQAHATGGLAVFAARRARLGALIDQLAGALKADGAGFDPPLRALRQRLDELRFEVAVVGEFSSGKSTFINALIGERVLPSSARPTTAILGRLVHGELGASIHFTDGRQVDIPITAIRDFVTERLNPANEKKVAQIEICAPVPLLRDGVTLIDTPGVGSLFDSHAVVAAAVIGRSDAVILLTDATQPLARSERDFLEKLKQHMGRRILVLANKIDEMTPPQAAKALAFIQKNVEQILPGVRVLPMAAYWALVARQLRSDAVQPADIADDPLLTGIADPQLLWEGSRFQDVENELFRQLVDNKGALVLDAVAAETRRALDAVQADAEARAANLDRDLSKVRAQVDVVLREAQHGSRRVDGIFADLDAGLRDVGIALRDGLRADRSRLRDAFARSIADATAAALIEGTRAQTERCYSGAVETLRERVEGLLERAQRELRDVSEDLQRIYVRQFEIRPVAGVIDRLPDADAHAGDDEPTLGMLVGGAGVVSAAAAIALGPIAVALTWGVAFAAGKLMEDRRAQRRLDESLEQFDMRLDSAEALCRQEADRYLTSVREHAVPAMRAAADGHVASLRDRATLMVRERDQAQVSSAPIRERLAQLRAVLGDVRTRLDSDS